MISARDARYGGIVRSIRHRASLSLAGAALFLSLVGGRAALAGDLDKLTRFNIPAESLDKALLAFGLQAHVQIMFAWDPTIDRLRSHIVRGRYTARQALVALLEGTQLQYSEHGNTITVAPDPPPAAAVRTPAHDDDAAEPSVEKSRKRKHAEAKKKEQREALQEVTVTGTYIRGTTPVGSPLIVYSREAIDESGAATIDEFARQLPENFSGADVLSSVIGNAAQTPTFDQSGNDEFGGTAFNLNGIGPGATLTLLNGHRLAPAGADGAFVDVSMIPLSAVERIEILPDGASAIYGSDAVAGVVNIITRRNFQGAQTNVSYGEATHGGAAEVTASQLLGKAWSSGNVMMTYEYDGESGLDASQRDFIPNQGGPDSLVPANWRNGVLISGNQDLGSNTSLSVDAIYSSRQYHSIVTVIPTAVYELYDIRNKATQSGVNMTLHRALARDWSLDVTGYYSEMRQLTAGIYDLDYPGGLEEDDTSFERTNTRLAGADLLAQGPLLELPGGALEAAVGGSFQKQGFVDHIWVTGTDNFAYPPVNARRHESSAYGELVVPIVGASNPLAWAHELELSVAARADHYSDFGSSANPKVGLMWSPVKGFDLRASYGTSYRAPLLSQLASPVISIAQLFADPISPSGLTDTLFIGGGNPNLRPERSRSFSVGPDVDIGGFSASATYLYTRYVDRVGIPPQGNLETVLVDPVDAPFVTRNPPLAAVEAWFNSPGFEGDEVGLGPAGVGAIFNSQDTNLETTMQSSVDVRIAYRKPSAIGVWTPSIAAVRQIRNELTASPTSGSLELLDLYGEPLRWKVRGGLDWTNGGYGAMVSLNYVNGYQDPFTTPPSAISSWTTADMHFSYRVPDTVDSGALSGITVALTVDNVTNERPPYVAIPLSVTGGAAPSPYDPANASPVGRFVSLEVNKQWTR